MKNALRIITLVVFCLLLNQVKAQPVYTRLNTGFTQNLNTVAIAPLGTVYIGGNTGLVARSTNEGQTWVALNLGASVTDTVVDIKTIGNDTLLVLTRGRLFRSFDGGVSFTGNLFRYNSVLRGMAAVNSKNIWAISNREPSGLFHTTNGGLSWDSVAVHPKSITSFLGITFASPTIGFAFGGAFRGVRSNAIYRTLNGGQSWDSLSSATLVLPGFSQFWAGYFPTPAKGYAVGAKNILSVTNDTGRTWNLLTTSDNSQPYLRCIAGRGDTILTFGDEGYGRSGFFSKDGGLTTTDLPTSWAPATLTGNDRRIVAVAYLNRNGYGVAGKGNVVKLTAASMRFIVSTPGPIDQRVAIYPMPIGRGTTLKIEGYNQQLNTLSLIDVLGKTIDVPFTQWDQQINATIPSTIAKGQYRLLIKSGSGTGQRSVVVE